MMARSAPANRERMVRRDLQLPAMAPAPRTRFSGPVSGHRVIETRRFDLADLKRIKASVPDATVNDVALTIVGGALRSYLAGKGELPEESLRAMAPISLRTPGERAVAGNQVSAMIVSLGTDIADPRERLVAVRESTHQSKQFSQAVDAQALMQLSEMVPGGLAALGARLASQFDVATRSSPIVNTVVSNVPGPQVPLYFAGARLVTMVSGAAVADGMGLFNGVLSYCGEVVITAVSDRDMMPDPAHYADCLGESFAALAQATAA